jgi:beta-lactam-binding protein with PASTA domain
MWPEHEDSTTFEFRAARDAGRPAGTYPFQVVARSTVNPDVVKRASGAVIVGAFSLVEGQLTPDVTRGRRPGRHRLEVVNSGNVPAAVRVVVQDEHDELTFRPRTFDRRLEPGERLDCPFEVEGPVPWFGRVRSMPFTAAVSASGLAQPQTYKATRRQLPWLPWWIPTAALALVGVVVAVLALLPKATVPSVANEPRVAAAADLKAAGYQPVAIFKPDKTTANGRAISTQPAAGTQLGHGNAVSLFVSQGPCPKGCPHLVPNVYFLPVDEATTQLHRAGLKTRALTATNDAVRGTVVATLPGPNSPVGPDKTVALTVSSGPAVASTAPSSGASKTSAASRSSASRSSASGSSTSAQVSTSSAAGGTPGKSSTRVNPLKVPNVVGLQLANALPLLNPIAKVNQVSQRTDDVPAGQVIKTDPPAGQALLSGGAVTVTVAVASADLVAAAAQATWTADQQALKLTFPTADSASPPAARTVPNAPLQDGSSSPTELLTQPRAQGGADVTAELPVAGGILNGDHLRGQVGFLQGGDGSVDFVVSAGGKELGRVAANATDTALQPLDVDLSPAAGQANLLISVVVRSDSTGLSDQAVWKDIKITAAPK